MKKNIKTTSYILLSAYLGIVVLFVLSVMMLPKWLNNFQEDYITKIEHKIQFEISQTPRINLAKNLEEIYEQEAIEIVVFDGEQKIIETVPTNNPRNLRGIINTKAIVNETLATFEAADEGPVDVWYIIYRPNLQSYLNNIALYQILILGTSFILLLITLSFLQWRTIRPLNALKKKIGQLSSYDFASITANEEDVINSEVSKFAAGLAGNIQAVTRKHSELEVALQLERERLANMIVISRGLLHDLKTPVSQTLIENDLILTRNEDLSKQTYMVAEYNIRRMDKLLLRINEILNLMDTDVKTMMESKKDFDLIKLFKTVRNIFEVDLKNRDLFLDSSYPEVIHITSNKVAWYLIIHNLLSNAIKYAKRSEDVIVDIIDNGDQITIIVENKTLSDNIERVKQSEQLFYATKKEDGYVYSTGNGLYLLKELTRMLMGEYKLEINGDTVRMELHIPK